MHGIIYSQLQQFVTKKYGSDIWNKLLSDNGLAGKVYMPTQVYPDSDAIALVTRASQLSGIPISQLLNSFGKFIVPSLLRIYSHSLNPNWSTIDLLEHVENTIHKAVRFADKGADPPKLKCKRNSTREIVIDYSSQRKMIDVGIGIIEGISEIKSEKIEITRKDSGSTTQLIVRSK